MSFPHLLKQIHSLSYTDTMILAEQLRQHIESLTKQKIEAVALAQVLSRVATDTRPAEEAMKEEEKILQTVFRRKVSCSIQRAGNGWQIAIPAIPGAQVSGKELRPLFPQMLDQAITLHCLMK